VSKAIPLAATRLTSKTGDGYRQVEFLVEFLATTIADSAHARVDRQHQRTEKPRWDGKSGNWREGRRCQRGAWGRGASSPAAFRRRRGSRARGNHSRSRTSHSWSRTS